MSEKNQNRTLLEAVGHQFQATTTTYDEKDAALYAVSIGASEDPLDTGDLQYTYELFSSGFHCFPTFAATFPLKTRVCWRSLRRAFLRGNSYTEAEPSEQGARNAGPKLRSRDS